MKTLNAIRVSNDWQIFLIPTKDVGHSFSSKTVKIINKTHRNLTPLTVFQDGLYDVKWKLDCVKTNNSNLKHFKKSSLKFLDKNSFGTDFHYFKLHLIIRLYWYFSSLLKMPFCRYIPQTGKQFFVGVYLNLSSETIVNSQFKARRPDWWRWCYHFDFASV